MTRTLRGGNGDPLLADDLDELTGPHQHPLYRQPERLVCGQAGCPGVPSQQQAPLTEERVRTSPLTVGALAMVFGALLALGAGVLAVSAHLRDARAAVVRVHDQSAASHPDIRASQERSTKRIEGRLDAVTHALDRIREDLRQRAAEPARRRRR